MSQIYKSSVPAPLPPSVATSYVTDNGTAIPAAYILNVLGGVGIETSANPNLSNNLFISLENTVQDTGTTINVQTINLSTIDCSLAGTYFFTSQLAAFTTGGNGLGGELYTTAISDGVSLTIIDDTDAVAHRTPALSAPGSTIGYEFISSGTNAILQVTGQNTFTINWSALTSHIYQG